METKGQIVLAKSMRTSRAWAPGPEFAVEETCDGLLLRPAGGLPESDLAQVADCLRSKWKAKALGQMHTAILREVGRRHDRGRY